MLAQARPADVPLISFSNDTSVAASDVFVMGMMPEQSIDRTVDYAIAKGARRFAAHRAQRRIRPPRGDGVGRARFRPRGGMLVATERYDRGNTSIISAAERLKAHGGFDTVLIADGARLSAMAAGDAQAGGKRAADASSAPNCGAATTT